MKHYAHQLLLLVPALVPGLCAAAPASGVTRHWRPLPASLWAVQAVVPPGTNNTQVLGSPAVVPFGVPGGSGPVPVSVGPGGGGPGGGGPGGGGPGGGGPGGAPIGADGRMPGLPPGVPVGPGAQPSGGSLPSRPGAGQSGGGVPSIVSTGPPASAVPKQATCTASLRLARTELPASGGEFSVPAVLEPAGCPANIAFTGTWLKIADAPGLRFIAEPNQSSAVRETMILVGGSSFFVRQLPPVQPGLAAAPSHLVFGVDKDGQTVTRRLSAWSERGAGRFTVRTGHPWLVVKPRRSKDNRQSFDVTVRGNAGLGPGRHDSFVELAPGGNSASPALRIPVVVEVTGKFN